MRAHDYDEPDSSQAMEMIQDALAHDNSPSKSDGSSLRFQQSNEMPDSPSDASHSVPQYHFHGLAETQTQKYGDQDEPQEGSQKENIGSVKTSKESPHSRSGSPHASSSHLQPMEWKGAVPSTTEKGATKMATNVIFQSPRPKGGMGVTANKTPAKKSPYKSTVQTTSRYKQPPRPPVRTDDSFANDPIYHNASNIATAEQFRPPLSEFTKDSTVRETDTSSGTFKDSMYDSMYGYPNRRPPRGKVLVEATPSCSSQSQSQQLDESQEDLYRNRGPENQLGLQQMEVDMDGNTSDFERSRSLGHIKHHDNEDFGPLHVPMHPDLLPTQSSGRDGDIQETQPSGEFDATQPSGEIEGTQPSTQVDDSNLGEPETTTEMTFKSAVDEILRSTITNSRTTTNNPSGPRSLLGMVSKENQERYKKYTSGQNSALAPSNLTSNSLASNTNNRRPSPVARPDLQETQPSFPEAPATKRGIPSKYVTSTTATTITKVTATPDTDAMEVVPDSEPGRLGMRAKKSTPSVPAPAKTPATGSSSTKRGKTPAVDIEMKVDETIAEEDEEDVPLATAAALVKRLRGRPPSKKSANSKGKEKEEAPRPPPTIPQKSNPPVRTIQKQATLPQTTARSWETGVVPSSMPEQDMPQGSRTMRNRPTVIAEPKKKSAKRAPPSKQSARATSNAPRSRQSEEIPATERNDDDNDTEKAEEEYQDEDMEEAAPGKKRKRTSLDKAGTPASNTRTATKRAKRGAAATPAPRANTRANTRTGTSTAKGNAAEATRVFALWLQDGYYYSGTVHSTDDRSQYKIHFDDKTSAWLTINQLRACELHVGDDVLFLERNRPAKVVNVDGFRNGTVEILVDGDVVEREVKKLRISATSILYGWDDRKLDPQSISTSLKPLKKQNHHLSPSPSKMSMLSLPPPVPNKQTKLLSETGLIVTLTTLKTKAEREEIMNNVKSTAAFLVDDWNSVLRMDGELSAQNNRWTLRKEDAQWVGDSSITRMLLIADDCNLKPKFLFALALGVPCVSTKWLRECVHEGSEQDFVKHLVPQGFSETLGATLTQQINVEWGSSAFDTPRIMSNTVAHKLFRGKSIICIGTDMMLQPKPKFGDKAKEGQHSIPRIILAMGADTVETVTAAQFALKPLSTYDYLLIKLPEQYLAEYAECTVVHWNWVKDCIIACRLHPLPVWTVEEEPSQEI